MFPKYHQKNPVLLFRFPPSTPKTLTYSRLQLSDPRTDSDVLLQVLEIEQGKDKVLNRRVLFGNKYKGRRGIKKTKGLRTWEFIEKYLYLG